MITDLHNFFANAWVLAYAVSMDLFTTTLQVVENHFSAIAKLHILPVKVVFQEDEITLSIPDREKLKQEGWKITEVFSPATVSLYYIQVWWL